MTEGAMLRVTLRERTNRGDSLIHTPQTVNDPTLPRSNSVADHRRLRGPIGWERDGHIVLLRTMADPSVMSMRGQA